MTEDELDWPPPESRFVDEKVALERIRDLTTTARTTWLVLIGFLAFIGLTLLSVRDVDFFSVSATTDLPIVNIAIPTTTFFWTASLLAAVLHTYFHIFLLQLWDALAEAPPEIDRLNLGDRVFPWLVNSWALRRRKDRPVTRRPMGLLSSVVTGIVIWLATPIVLAGFWWWSLPAHDARVSLAIAAALWISLFASMRGWRRARSRLAQPGLIAKQRQNQTIWQRLGVARRGFVTLLLWLLILAGVPLLAVATVAGTGGHHLAPIVESTLSAKWPENWGAIPYASADLVDAEIAIEPDDWRDPEIARRRFHVDWCRDSGVPVAACESPASGETNVARAEACRAKGIAFADCVAHFAGIDAAFEEEWQIERRADIDDIRGPDLRGRDLRNADASGAFLAGVDLRGARLEGADLSRAGLEGAYLYQAWLDGADLSRAGLEGADLTLARLEGADLSRAGLERANLGLAELEGADLRDARLEGADLSRARLEGAYLYQAWLDGADLRWAGLEGADLRWARLEGAYLYQAWLDGADLRWAQFQSAEWASATFAASLAHSADFTRGKNLTQTQLAQVIGDADTVLPLDAETGEPLHVWSCWEEAAAARFIELWTAHRDDAPDKLREWIISEGWICGPDNPRRPVGTLAEDVVEDSR